MSIALYPGTFDPMTFGHIDLAIWPDADVMRSEEVAGSTRISSIAPTSDQLTL